MTTVAPPLNLWEVARVDVSRLDGAQRTEAIGWVSGLGVDVNGIRPQLAISQDGDDGSYRLHLSRYVTDEHGRRVVDHAADQLQIEPLVIPITDWPQWLVNVSHTQGGTGGDVRPDQ
ncbi:MAG TPA: hypothetical protein VIQ30_05500 [Pseudonocardia sp.]